MSTKDSDSDRFRPTQTHPIVELTKRTDKIPKGFVCPSCGHLAVEEDEILGMICPKCLQQWLADQNVQQMVSIGELHDDRESALVPTIKVDDIKKKETHPYDETTKIMPNEPSVEDITLGKVLQKKKKVTDSDDRIPGL
jgi:hypothetical protein